LATHTWRSASIGNLGGWQVARCLFFLNILTDSVGKPGGTSANSWNKFVPKPFNSPPPFDAWNELHLPDEWPLAHYEMSFLLPHFLEEGRGQIDVYFTRVYNPMWTNPDGFMWLKAFQDEDKIKCHVALTPTWNESAWFADYVLPMGLASERHDLMSQETHAGQWIAFRQPVRRGALERAGQPVRFTYEANPGEVWEENEWWIELSARMDKDGSLGIRNWFESPYRPGEIINVSEYYRWIFENSVPGLPDAATAEGLAPLDYMRKYGAFEVKEENYQPYEAELPGLTQKENKKLESLVFRLAEAARGIAREALKKKPEGIAVDSADRILKNGKTIGVMIDGKPKVGVATPSRKFEFYSPTLRDWGWAEKEYVIPWPLPSHVAPSNIDLAQGEMLLLPNFRLPTLIHTRSANAKWLYEISHKNPVVWVTEGIKPGVLAMSHHLGRWRLTEEAGVNRGASSLARLEDDDQGSFTLNIIHGAQAWKSSDPDTSRVWWNDVGVHQNLTHAVQPDPVSGGHCWLQKAVNVAKAGPDDRHGDVWVDTNRSMEVYRRWREMTRPASKVSPDGNRRPMWLNRPLRPTAAGYKLKDEVQPES
jgi:anaerobic selenocysteine-containing dehydrogenase